MASLIRSRNSIIVPPPALLGAELTVAIVEGVAVAAWLGRPAIAPALVAAAAANLVSTLGGLALSAWLAR